MCVYIAAAGSVKICVQDLTTTCLLTPRGYGIVCMHAGSTQYLYYTH